MQKCLPESNYDEAPIHRSLVVKTWYFEGTETSACNLLTTTTAAFVKTNRLEGNKRPTDWETIKGEAKRGKAIL
jgi:hypothetical protein